MRAFALQREEGVSFLGERKEKSKFPVSFPFQKRHASFYLLSAVAEREKEIRVDGRKEACLLYPSSVQPGLSLPLQD